MKHAWFDENYHAGRDGRELFHPRIVALKKKINELLGDKSYIELVGNIQGLICTD